MAHKSSLEMIPKVWGEEAIIVNCDKYCGKLLFLKRGAVSSLHYHKEKQETFFLLEGEVVLSIGDGDYLLVLPSSPKTIFPNEKHQFRGVTDAVVLEVSTHHSDDDVVRLSESKSG